MLVIRAHRFVICAHRFVIRSHGFIILVHMDFYFFFICQLGHSIILEHTCSKWILFSAITVTCVWSGLFEFGSMQNLSIVSINACEYMYKTICKHSALLKM